MLAGNQKEKAAPYGPVLVRIQGIRMLDALKRTGKKWNGYRCAALAVFFVCAGFTVVCRNWFYGDIESFKAAYDDSEAKGKIADSDDDTLLLF